MAVGCGDKCEQLCVQTAARIDECKPESLSWADLGARGKNDFANACREDWSRLSAELTTSDLREALEVCDETLPSLLALSGLTCDEVNALYLPIE
ncbi:MAG: hypothetical protein GWP91_16950 [Rhodobacterales bacterium]|nr:hypothetical protein [Rhodobacterales bacterium]